MSEKRHNELLEKKYMLEENLMNLERQIYDLETRYLEETTNTGNIIKGWEGYLQQKNNQKNQTQRKVKINIADRLFSLSSLTSPAQINEEINTEKQNGAAQVLHPFRPKRTKKNKNYAKMGENKQQQEQIFRENNDIDSSSSSDEYQGGVKKKIKGIKKY